MDEAQGAHLTSDLARFVVQLDSANLPAAARERSKDILLDAIASAMAGQDASESPMVVALARALGNTTDSTVIGGGRLSPAGATLVNGYLITAVTVCDIHRPTSCHVTPEVVAPALVTAEQVAASGSNLLAAIAAGLEVTTRVGLGLDPKAFRARGWHAPGITGPFGGAAAVGKLLQLDERSQRDAFGIAGSQAAGTYAQLGTPTIKFQQSRGALGGLMSATLAHQGFGAAAEILLHPDGGLFSAYSGGGSPEVVLADIGERWELMEISLRAWPVAALLQSLVTGLMFILEEDDRPPATIAEIRIGMSERAYRMHGTVPFDDRFRARLSAPYVTGVVLHDRRCWLEQFTPDRVADPDLERFVRERVTTYADSAVPDDGMQIDLTRVDGSAQQHTVTVPKGDPKAPLTRGEIESKFRVAAAPRISATAIDAVIASIGNLEEVEDVRDLCSLLRAD